MHGLIDNRIIITKHAQDRLTERIACHPSKYQKIVTKAYRSKERISDREAQNARYYIVELSQGKKDIFYRKLMGRIFVFDKLSHKAIVLITVIPIRKKQKRRYKKYDYI